MKPGTINGAKIAALGKGAKGSATSNLIPKCEVKNNLKKAKG